MKDNVQKIIYIIDNEPIAIKTIQGFLTDLGHKVFSFISSAELPDASEKNTDPVNLILIGLDLPDPEHIKKIRDVHAQYPDTPIIIIKGHGPVFSHEDAISNGIYAYLNRPIRLGELELMVDRLS